MISRQNSVISLSNESNSSSISQRSKKLDYNNQYNITDQNNLNYLSKNYVNMIVAIWGTDKFGQLGICNSYNDVEEITTEIPDK